ncbi:unnamed protein product [Medioppia subpectinata]|uniref:Calcineurin-like phosphoesterase domain-containing protein n=1 Tax=Medioppia subpectinata TaxID=1979941 RepID=A0A7R9KTU5_9ACAR|nr:unnamed protein product [Medioppia subpectinata]CAG2109621.1 unnamed protein product [Medioppia subpectinata]
MCRSPPLTGHTIAGQPVSAMVLSDTHLLGRLRGHWFDKLRREWQMYRSFQTSLDLFSPQVVIVLGDVFDEGQWASDQDFDTYVDRFYHLFGVDSDNTRMIVVVGNHDIGFHYWTDRYLRRRFEYAFNTTDVDLIELANGVHLVAINSIALEGDECYLCVGAVHKLTTIGEHLKSRNISPIVLMHFPMFRDSEDRCVESDSLSSVEPKIAKNKEKIDCLSKESTNLVLEVLRPRLVLTGHSHYSCVVTHEWREPDVKSVVEWTVASFSWRNNKSPSFLLLSLTSDDYSLFKCFLPNENLVFLIYLISLLALICLEMMHFMLLFSRQGKLRLQKWFAAQPDKSKKKTVRELVTIILSRKPKLCSFLEWKDLKIVYKRYASLYFCCAVEQTDNELLTLEIIHRYVELLDKYFGSVCELDIIFNFEKAYFILDELLIGGEIQETSKKNVLKAIAAQDLLQEEETPQGFFEDHGLG